MNEKLRSYRSKPEIEAGTKIRVMRGYRKGENGTATLRQNNYVWVEFGDGKRVGPYNIQSIALAR